MKFPYFSAVAMCMGCTSQGIERPASELVLVSAAPHASRSSASPQGPASAAPHAAFCGLGLPTQGIPVLALDDLVRNVGRYNNQLVQVRGWASVRYERTALFPSPAAVDQFGLTGGAIWLRLSRSSLDGTIGCNGRSVVVSGVVRREERGHYGAYELGLEVESMQLP